MQFDCAYSEMCAGWISVVTTGLRLQWVVIMKSEERRMLQITCVPLQNILSHLFA
jgi:hypothetical protein